MPEHTWTFDAADGVYKNHYISADILKLAAKKLVFAGFTDLVDGFGKGKGETVNIFHYKAADVPDTAELSERMRMPIDKISMGSRAITVKEWGRGMQYTNLNQQLSKFDPKDQLQKALAEQMRECLDKGAATAFKAAKIKFSPTSLTGGTWATNGTAGASALVNLTKAHLGLIRDYMTNDIHIPFYEGDHYVGVFATKALRGLKDDRVLEAWHQYLRKGDMLYKSEVGKVESIRLIENVNTNALSNGIGSGSVLGEGVIFGDEAVSRVEVDAPELRADPNYQGDFGRIKAVAWYGILAFGITWDTASDREAKVVHITST